MYLDRYRRIISKYLPYFYFVLGLGYLVMWLLAYVRDTTWRADFTAFYTAGSLLRYGYAERLYDFALQSQHQQALLGENDLGGGYLAFYYPPYVALLFLPLSYLRLDAGYMVWSLLQFGLIGYGIYKFTNRAKKQGWSKRELLYFLGGAAAIPAFRSALQLGTVTFLMLAVLLGLLFALKDKRDWLAAVFIVLGAIKPQVMLLPALLVLAMRRWRVIAYAVLLFVIMAAGTTFYFGWSIWLDMIPAMTGAYSHGATLGVMPTAMYNFKGLLTLILGRTSAVDLVSLLLFCLSGVGVLLIGHVTIRQDDHLEWAYALTVLLSTLFGLHVNPQDGMYIIVAALCMYSISREKNLGYHWDIVLAGAPLAFSVYQALVLPWFHVQFPVLFMLWMIVSLLRFCWTSNWRAVGRK